MWQKLMVTHFLAKIYGNTVLCEQGFIENKVKSDGNALGGKNQR